MRAQQLRVDDSKRLADYQSARTAGLTAQAITRWLRTALRSFRTR